MPQVIACDFSHFATLVPVDSRLRSLHIPRRPRLNFNETKNIFIPADQVDLSPAAGSAKVSGYHGIA